MDTIFFPSGTQKYPVIIPINFQTLPEHLCLKIGDTITIRVFFKIGTGNNIHVDGDCIALGVEFIDGDMIFAGINLLLLDKFPLKTGGSLEIFEDKILYKTDSKVN